VIRSVDTSAGETRIRGFLHEPAQPGPDAAVLTHGAGSSAGSHVLAALGEALAARGVTTLRCDLAFRQLRPTGPPRAGDAARDRAGLAAAVALVRSSAAGRILLGGLSYGGRQASMLAAERPHLANALLLLAYPLRPPSGPERTGHFPALQTPAFFVHGTRDPFGSPDDLRAALAAIPARTELLVVDRAGHDLAPLRTPGDAARAADAFLAFAG
jgi:predicted alpha/beta-hydrolase family hydrolase